MAQQVILSIQSAVMHGAVGNDAAMPIYHHCQQPAERLDTVRLAAHPGFGTTALSLTPAEDIAALLTDYRQLDSFSDLAAIQTGYFGHHHQIDPVAKFIATSQAARSQMIYLLDPVLGDGGRLYVDQAICEAMRDKLLPLAHIITPNQFELSLLSDSAITDETRAIEAARSLLGGRLHTVFVTGVPINDGQIADIIVDAETETLFIAKKQANGVSGSGDVLSAFFLSACLGGATTAKAAEAASYKTAQILSHADTQLSMPVLRSIWQDIV